MKFLKRLLVFLIPVIVPLIILTSLSVFFALNDVKRDTIKYNHSLLMQTRDNIDLMLNELDTLSYSFDSASNPDISNIVRNVFDRNAHTYDSNLMFNTMAAFLNSYAHTKPYVHSIYIYYNNTNRNFLSTSHGIVNLNHYFDNQWIHLFEEQASNTVYRSQTRQVSFSSLEQASPIITITKRFFSADGGVVLNLHPKYIQSAIAHSNLYPSQSLVIFNENNEVLFKQLSKDDPEQLHTNLFDGDDVFHRYRSGDDDFAVFKVRSNKYGWTYMTFMPYSNFFQIPGKILTTTIILSLAMLVIGTALATYLLRRDHNRTNLEQSYLQMQLSERKYKLKAMELLALQSQINPHFLFNTLETMNWKAVSLTGKPNELNGMIDHLSSILRYSLDSHTEAVPMNEEIKNTKSYIDILKNRYKNKFDVLWEYDEQEMVNCYTPKLLLQPLVENAIYHGIRETDGLGQIKIKMYTWHNQMRIIIIDNGLGISKQRLQFIKKLLLEDDEPSSKHIGLVNTAKRLRLAYGDQCRLRVNSKPGWGTMVVITLPLNKK